MTGDKPTVFCAQDVQSERRVCRTKAETRDALGWLIGLRAEHRVLDWRVGTDGFGPNIIEATWVATVA